jgi:site-specific DNA-methyltransferase (cytosine-N4-specific)
LLKKSDLPFGSEFSPSQINLAELLSFVSESKSDWRALENRIFERYFKHNKTSEYNRRKLANNCKLGLKAYGIIDESGAFTDWGTYLFQHKDNDEDLYRILASHILTDLHGLDVIQTIEDMQARGERVDLLKLRKWLGERGIHFPRGGKHPSIMRLWLEKAGVIRNENWEIDHNKLEAILGLKGEELEKLSMLDRQQKAYLKTIANMGGTGPFPSNEIERLTTTLYGIEFNEKNLPKTVLYPLRDLGYIEIERGTKISGRGAKPFSVKPSEKFQREVSIPLITALEKQVDGELRPLLRKPLKGILDDLHSKDRHTKGLALEALAFYLMRLIDLKYVATRLRGANTGGAEVDLIFEGTRLLFSRWQIQCKNTNAVSLDDVAKEVGLTFQLKSNVIMVVSTGIVGIEARKYASHVMQTSNLDIVLVDRADLETLTRKPYEIATILEREAQRAMKMKQLII